MRFPHEDISAEADKHDSLLRKRPCGSHPDPAMRQNQHHAYRLSGHVPERSDGKGKSACVLPDARFRIYQNCMFPGKPLHNRRRIHGDMRIRRS